MIHSKGYAATHPHAQLTPFSFTRRSPGPEDVLIDIKFCGVCHSDLHQARDEWGGSIFPMVPGHEIVGIVAQVGSNVRKFKIGDAVGVGCMVNSCRQCSSCQEGLEQYCSNGSTLTYNGYEKDGTTATYGGYAKNIVVDENFVLKIPKGMPLDAAAPLLCAGITTYSPLRHWQAGPGKKVAVLGLGGLGHVAVKLARALGAEVSVLSHSQKKSADAQRLGAHHFHVMGDSQSEIFSRLSNSFDLILNTVSVDLDLNAYLQLLKRDGSLVMLGIPIKDGAIGAFPLILKRRHLCGSLIGGIQETQEMLDFCGKHGIVSDIEVISMEKINEAYERMLRGDVRYRFVIDLQTLS